MKGHTDHAAARSSIMHPALLEAFDHDWYYPWLPHEWPESDRQHPSVKTASAEGWAGWICDQSDLEAVKAGYKYDLSRDRDGNPCCWHRGQWWRITPTVITKPKRKSPSKPLRKSAKSAFHSSSSLTLPPQPSFTLDPIPRGLAEHPDPAKRIIVHFGAGDLRCRFVEMFLVYTKSGLATDPGSPYRLIYWQRLVMLSVFGWVRQSTDRSGDTIYVRRFSKAWIEIPKKNGKSDFVSTATITMIKGDGERKAYVYGAAGDKNQASIVFNEARDYVRASEQLAKLLFINDSRITQRITDFESGSFYEVVSADANTKDGFDAHSVIFDELHQLRDRKLYVIFKRSGMARQQPIEWVITTYGYTLKSIWGEVHLKAKAILSGKATKIHHYVFIASAEPIPVVIVRPAAAGDTLLHVHRLEQSIDAGETIELENAAGGTNIIVRTTRPAKRFQRFIEVEPVPADIPDLSEGLANTDPLNPDRLDHAIRRANPSVDIVMPHERIKTEILDSEGPQGEAEAKRFNLNILAGDGNLWLSGAAWLAGGRHRIVPSKLLGGRCFGGLDVSQSNDLTAFWLAFPNWKRGTLFGRVKKPLITLIGIAWVPDDQIERREEAEEIAYRSLAAAKYFGPFGFVRICHGETIRYDEVGKDIVTLTKYFKCQAVAYDPHRAGTIIEDHLMPAGLPCLPHRQGAITMGPAAMQFEYLVKRRALAHGNHPLLDAAVEGCVLTQPDRAGNRFPAKDKSLSRIDPLISAVMACNWCCHPPKELPATGAYSGDPGTGAIDPTLSTSF